MEPKIFFYASFVDAFCFFHGREPRIDCMLLTEAASVPRKDFSSSSLERMRQCDMVGMGSWAPVGGKILDSSMRRESYILDQRSGLSTLN